jgi:hypothetical protein
MNNSQKELATLTQKYRELEMKHDKLEIIHREQQQDQQQQENEQNLKFRGSEKKSD